MMWSRVADQASVEGRPRSTGAKHSWQTHSSRSYTEKRTLSGMRNLLDVFRRAACEHRLEQYRAVSWSTIVNTSWHHEHGPETKTRGFFGGLAFLAGCRSVRSHRGHAGPT